MDEAANTGRDGGKARGKLGINRRVKNFDYKLAVIPSFQDGIPPLASGTLALCHLYSSATSSWR